MEPDYNITETDIITKKIEADIKQTNTQIIATTVNPANSEIYVKLKDNVSVKDISDYLIFLEKYSDSFKYGKLFVSKVSKINVDNKKIEFSVGSDEHDYLIKSSGEIKKYLEYSYANWFNTVYSSDDFMLSLREIRNNSNDKERRKKYQLTTPYYNLDYAVGLNYSVDISKKPNERITIISLSDGNPFDLEKTYTVVLNSYRGNGGGGHLTQGVGLSKDELKLRLISSSKRDFRKFFIDYIKNTKKIIPFRYDNWKIIPEEIFNKCRQIEFELLFGL